MNNFLLIDGWEEYELWKHLMKQDSRRDIKITGSHRGRSFLSTQKQYKGYLIDDKF